MYWSLDKIYISNFFLMIKSFKFLKKISIYLEFSENEAKKKEYRKKKLILWFESLFEIESVLWLVNL